MMFATSPNCPQKCVFVYREIKWQNTDDLDEDNSYCCWTHKFEISKNKELKIKGKKKKRCTGLILPFSLQAWNWPCLRVLLSALSLSFHPALDPTDSRRPFTALSWVALASSHQDLGLSQVRQQASFQGRPRCCDQAQSRPPAPPVPAHPAPRVHPLDASLTQRSPQALPQNRSQPESDTTGHGLGFFP